MSLGVKLIKNFNAIETTLEQWMAKPILDKTWINFKTHFDIAHANLHELRSKIMHNTTSAQITNMIRTQAM